MRGKELVRKLRRHHSNAESRLWQALRAHRLMGFQFRRQSPCGPFIADFLCHAARLVIEIDGATHSTDEKLRRDRRRDAWFRAKGWRVLRFRNEEVYENFEGVIETILAHLPSAPSPTLPRIWSKSATSREVGNSRLPDADFVPAGEGADASLLLDGSPRVQAVPSPAERGREREGVAPPDPSPTKPP